MRPGIARALLRVTKGPEEFVTYIARDSRDKLLPLCHVR